MNYCFVSSFQSLSPKGGVKMQAEMWKAGLEKLGHSVTMSGSWDTPNWSSFDAVIIFGFAPGVRNLVKMLERENPNLIYAPIIDPVWSEKIFKFIVKYWGSQKILGLSSQFHDLWLAAKYPILWLVRSEEERHFVNYALEIPLEKIVKIPLHFRIPPMEEAFKKENYCFHASRLRAKEKNVPRLIAAAKKYGFNLKLAGHLMGESDRRWLLKLIGDSKNIEYVGEVSEEKLLDLYKKAKVFALPSLQEGVGMVALEAAAYGCEIVLTNYGAPKEYYCGKALLVDPKNIDEIGLKILEAINQGYSQPKLKDYVEQNYSEKILMNHLNDEIIKAITRHQS